MFDTLLQLYIQTKKQLTNMPFNLQQKEHIAVYDQYSLQLQNAINFINKHGKEPQNNIIDYYGRHTDILIHFCSVMLLKESTNQDTTNTQILKQQVSNLWKIKKEFLQLNLSYKQPILPCPGLPESAIALMPDYESPFNELFRRETRDLDKLKAFVLAPERTFYKEQLDAYFDLYIHITELENALYADCVNNKLLLGEVEAKTTSIIKLYCELVAESVTASLEGRVISTEARKLTPAILSHEHYPLMSTQVHTSAINTVAKGLLIGFAVGIILTGLVILLSQIHAVGHAFEHVITVFSASNHGLGMSLIGSIAKEGTNLALITVAATTVIGGIAGYTRHARHAPKHIFPDNLGIRSHERANITQAATSLSTVLYPANPFILGGSSPGRKGSGSTPTTPDRSSNKNDKNAKSPGRAGVASIIN